MHMASARLREWADMAGTGTLNLDGSRQPCGQYSIYDPANGTQVLVDTG